MSTAHLKTDWLPLLAYMRALHQRAVRPAQAPLPYAWEEIGPGYCWGPAFGHWDIVHQIIDGAADDPVHAQRQVDNNLANQQADGIIPGSLWFKGDRPAEFSTAHSHPPVWPAAVDACQQARPDRAALARALAAAERQLGWFHRHRLAPGGGCFYSDILKTSYESGIDQGVRFDHAPAEPAACIDATCHVAFLAGRAAAWAGQLGRDATALQATAEALGSFVREQLWCTESGFFHDAWSVGDPSRRHLVHEGFWPLALGLASQAQADELIDRYLLSPLHFLTAHPLPSVAVSDPAFSLRMWRGPTWNSITWWVAQGCIGYGRADAARVLLERSLDSTAEVYGRTRAIWEFYHPFAGDPLACQRKPETPYDVPCRDYLGHNPMLAMARLYGSLAAGTDPAEMSKRLLQPRSRPDHAVDEATAVNDSRPFVAV